MLQASWGRGRGRSSASSHLGPAARGHCCMDPSGRPLPAAASIHPGLYLGRGRHSIAQHPGAGSPVRLTRWHQQPQRPALLLPTLGSQALHQAWEYQSAWHGPVSWSRAGSQQGCALPREPLYRSSEGCGSYRYSHLPPSFPLLFWAVKAGGLSRVPPRAVCFALS